MNAKQIALGGIALGAALWMLQASRRRTRRLDWKNRVVLITGGSRGLGLVMARQLADAGARVVICARKAEELERAQQELTQRGALVMAETCDVTDAMAIRDFTQRVLKTFGHIDVLINNAGVIQVGPMETMCEEDYQQALATHFWGPWHFIANILPAMKSRRAGRIANISSIGGEVSVPHLIPYCTSKFALSGFSQGLQAELARHNILITTVHPHLMRTGSHHNAQFKGRHRAEFTWFSLGASLPFLSMDASRAAEKILDAIQHGDPEITLALPGKLASRLYRTFPSLSARLAALANQLLPTPPTKDGATSYLGHESHSWLAPSVLTALGDRAAEHNNELG